MYSKSNPRRTWQNLQGNLDLFVMERNERHLTSLHWKWHKLSPGRKTLGYEEEETTGQYTNATAHWSIPHARRNYYDKYVISDVANYETPKRYHGLFHSRLPPAIPVDNESKNLFEQDPFESRQSVLGSPTWKTKESSHTGQDYGLQTATESVSHKRMFCRNSEKFAVPPKFSAIFSPRRVVHAEYIGTETPRIAESIGNCLVDQKVDTAKDESCRAHCVNSAFRQRYGAEREHSFYGISNPTRYCERWSSEMVSTRRRKNFNKHIRLPLKKMAEESHPGLTKPQTAPYKNCEMLSKPMKEPLSNQSYNIAWSSGKPSPSDVKLLLLDRSASEDISYSGIPASGINKWMQWSKIIEDSYKEFGDSAPLTTPESLYDIQEYTDKESSIEVRSVNFANVLCESSMTTIRDRHNSKLTANQFNVVVDQKVIEKHQTGSSAEDCFKRQRDLREKIEVDGSCEDNDFIDSGKKITGNQTSNVKKTDCCSVGMGNLTKKQQPIRGLSSHSSTTVTDTDVEKNPDVAAHEKSQSAFMELANATCNEEEQSNTQTEKYFDISETDIIDKGYYPVGPDESTTSVSLLRLRNASEELQETDECITIKNKGNLGKSLTQMESENRSPSALKSQFSYLSDCHVKDMLNEDISSLQYAKLQKANSALKKPQRTNDRIEERKTDETIKVGPETAQFYCQEQLRLIEEGKGNEEAVFTLHHEHTMLETDLSSLRQELAAERIQQNKSPHERFVVQEKIDEIENQIAELNKKILGKEGSLIGGDRLCQLLERMGSQVSFHDESFAHGSERATRMATISRSNSDIGTFATFTSGGDQKIKIEPATIEANVSDDEIFFSTESEQEKLNVQRDLQSPGEDKTKSRLEKNVNELKVKSPEKRYSRAAYVEEEMKHTSKGINLSVTAGEGLKEAHRETSNDPSDLSKLSSLTSRSDNQDAIYTIDIIELPILSPRSTENVCKIASSQHVDSKLSSRVSIVDNSRASYSRKIFTGRNFSQVSVDKQDSRKTPSRKLMDRLKIFKKREILQRRQAMLSSESDNVVDIRNEQLKDDRVTDSSEISMRTTNTGQKKIFRFSDNISKQLTSESLHSKLSDLVGVCKDLESKLDGSQTNLPQQDDRGGWSENRKNVSNSVLEGLGSNWCVAPYFIWKCFGDEFDDEHITRKKCIAFLMGITLVILFVAAILGLAIGLAFSGSAAAEQERSPIRFVVIPSDSDDLQNGR